MLNDKDRKQLEWLVGREARNFQTTQIFAIFCALFAGIVNLYLAGWIASLHGDSYRTFLEQYMAGISAQRYYSGLVVKAMERFGTGVLEIMMSLAMALGWWNLRKRRGQAQRIINALKGSGAW